MYEHIKTNFSSMEEFVRHLTSLFLDPVANRDDDWPPASWSDTQFDAQFRQAKIPGWTFVGRGSYRAVYSRNDRKYVLKIPRVRKGIQDCINEAALYRHRNGKLNPEAPDIHQGALAPCRVVKIAGISCLIMPKLATSIPYKEHPAWVNQLADGRQIGRDRKNNIVVYDYGNEIDGPWSPETERRALNYTNDRLRYYVMNK